MEKLLPTGLWPVMLTPFKENYKIDIEGLKQLTEFYLSAGANGLFANCLSSEMFQLTDDERVLITEIVVKQVNGRIPVVSTGTFSKNLSVNCEFINRIHDTGVRAVIVNSNQLNDKSETEAAFKAKIEELLQATGNIQLGIYECPVPYKRLLSKDLVKWLGQTGRFSYLKDTSCDIDQLREKIDAAWGTPLCLFNANTPTALASLGLGAHGLSPIAANFYPELYSFIIKNPNHNDEQVNQVNTLLTALDEIADNQYYPFSAKLFLKKRGVNIQEVMRMSNPSLEQQDLIKLGAMMKLITDTALKLGIDLVDFKNEKLAV